MDKEKEIEEMSEKIGHALGITYEGERLPFTMHTRNYLAKVLVVAGYRKADEVRKETLKEIWDRLFKKADNTWNNRLNLSKQDIRSFAAQDGVEVDE